MVARTRKTNSVARSVHVGEPSVRAPDDGASTSTSRRRVGSASSSRDTRVSELQGMLANLIDMVTGLTAQQAVILRQTQPVFAVLPPPPVPAVPAAPPPVAAIPEVAPPPAAVLAPLLPIPAVAEALAPAPQAAPLSIQSSGSSRPPIRPFRFQEVHQNPLPPCPLPQPVFLSPAFPPFLAGRDPFFPGAQALHYGPDPFFGPMDGNAPFSEAIRLAPIPEDFRPPKLEVYRGATDPREHVQGFEAAVRYRRPDKATRCHLLANTLKGAAFSWFIKLPRGHITSYEHLKWELIARFIGRTRMVVSDMVLANIKQGERENLRDYTNRFFAAAAEAEDVEPAVAMHNFRRWLKVGDLFKSLQLAKPRSYSELVARATQFMLLEDAAESSPAGVSGERNKRKHQGVEPPVTRVPMARPRDREEGRPRQTQPPKLLLSRPLPEVYAAAIKQGWIRPTGPKPAPPPGADPNDYCEFHGNYGHRLHRCRGLRILLEKLCTKASLRSSCKWPQLSLPPRKEKPPRLLRHLPRPYHP
ncbi:hypothetical protein AXF42_Ash006264 [Apostasia shenzhenica]|uniref:Retrotransposon gag domain-containing protein n=1 Tax=Apostasia shenzhenica TaxID=1088818 RepID=A0A2I0AYK9_9ASPA|nr:hypothetical protein AXF42_Ash006264 [Apostasia shenzhenica]